MKRINLTPELLTEVVITSPLSTDSTVACPRCQVTFSLNELRVTPKLTLKPNFQARLEKVLNEVRMPGLELIKVARVAEKIESQLNAMKMNVADNGELKTEPTAILLEDEEFSLVKPKIETFDDYIGIGWNEFVNAFLNAEEVK